MSWNYGQVPAWLENNRLLRFAFVFRKAFLSNSKGIHYAQFGEDLSIASLFGESYTGCFVDVGCFHPKKYSNTWMLYRRGWRGVNIDIDAVKIETFNLVRPADTNIACAISDEEGTISYFTNGFYSLMVTLDRDFTNRTPENRHGYVEKQTTCRTLTSVLDGSPYRDTTIDVLSVDAEGHDLEVLKSLDFERYAPKIIAVETHVALFEDVQETPLYAFLTGLGYGLVAWCGYTLILASPGYKETLKEVRAGVAES